MPTQTKHSQLKSFLRYAFSLDLDARFRRLGASLAMFPYILALIFRSFRLLPESHPVLAPENFGKYGFSYVFSAAGQNLKISKDNIDQILVYIAVCLTFVFVFLQALFTIIGMAFGTPARAANIFTTPDEYVQFDYSLTLLQHAFGIGSPTSGGFFSDNVAPNYDEVEKIQHIFFKMMSIYSTGLMILAVLLIVYYVFTIVAEAAYTGKPFGNRFNPLYAPIRIVLGLGLLVPLGSGLNAAQYTVFYVAKFGVGLANNAWYTYVDDLANTPIHAALKPNATDGNLLVANLFKSEVCKHAYNQSWQKQTGSYGAIQPFLVYTDNGKAYKKDWATIGSDIPAYLYTPTINKNVRIVYTNIDGATTYSGKNYCGEHSINIATYARIHGVSKAHSAAEDAIAKMEENAYLAVKETFKMINGSNVPKLVACSKLACIGDNPKPNPYPDAPAKVDELLTDARDFYVGAIEADADGDMSSVLDSISTEKKELAEDMKSSGWASAGAYYAVVGRYLRMATQASLNPVYSGYSVETEYMYPMTAYQQSSFMSQIFTSTTTRADIQQADDYAADLAKPFTEASATYAKHTSIGQAASAERCDFKNYEVVTNALKQADWTTALTFIFDLCTLEDMRNSKSLDPMFYFVKMGHEKVTRAVNIIKWTLGLQMVPGPAGDLMKSFAGVINMVGLIGITVGIELAYILPLLPFIYFTIAILSWVLAIFQALLGLPLWAFAHIQISGDGIPGPVAASGYKFLIEIMLRPVLMLMTLIGVFFIIGAANYFVASFFVEGTKEIRFTLLSEIQSPIEELMMTIAYGVVMFGIVNTLVKLTDTLPQTVMNWGGLQAGYNDPLNGTPFDGAAKGIAAAGWGIVNGLPNAASGLSKSIGGTASGVKNLLAGSNPATKKGK